MKRIVFIAAMAGQPWGGSEELWSQAAARLHAERADRGLAVSVCVRGWSTGLPAPVAALAAAGVDLHVLRFSPWDRARLHWGDRRGRPRPLIYAAKSVRWLDACRPALVVISQGGNADGQAWMEHCRQRGFPYAVVCQHANELEWPTDAVTGSLREGYLHARGAFFVSRHNLELTETQIGRRLPDAEVVWNPRALRTADPLPWPGAGTEWRWACVGRLEPHHKGQDLLLRALARAPWTERNLRVRFFGRGAMEHGLKALADLLAPPRVEFTGHAADVESIWRDHHLLVLPSRAEGLPLALTEAMWCGRPAVVTTAGGNAELLEEGRTGFVAEAPTVPALAAAMDRAWERRETWETMGREAAAAIRRRMPVDPVGDFCGRLLTLL